MNFVLPLVLLVPALVVLVGQRGGSHMAQARRDPLGAGARGQASQGTGAAGRAAATPGSWSGGRRGR